MTGAPSFFRLRPFAPSPRTPLPAHKVRAMPEETEPVPPAPAPTGKTPPASSPPAGAPPPAASAVLSGTRTEGDTDLGAELEKERAARKAEQIRLAELEDENRRLKTPPPNPATAQKRSWLEGGTFFG